MARYAFIDVQNTASTTEQMLGFLIDWHKLCEFLKTKWEIDEVFLYSGIELGDEETAEVFESLSADFGCVVRTKTVMVYKNPDKKVSVKCPGCEEEWVKVIEMGYRKKSNCDVELTADAIERAGEGSELYIFTGDGDFGYLMERAIEKGSRIKIVSNAQKKIRAGYTFSRFSTRLRDLIAQNRETVTMVDIGRLKDIIKRDV